VPVRRLEHRLRELRLLLRRLLLALRHRHRARFPSGIGRGRLQEFQNSRS
jgi:hypothetical protein